VPRVSRTLVKFGTRSYKLSPSKKRLSRGGKTRFVQTQTPLTGVVVSA
jgi:hypothetical protein